MLPASFRDRLKDAARSLLGERGYAALHARAVAARLQREEAAPDPLVADLLTRYLRPGDVALDVGAHTGAWTYPLARRIGPAGHVVAFEALPHYARVVRRALERLHVGNVTLHHAALARDEGTATLVTHTPDGALLTGRTHLRGQGEHEGAGAVHVPTRPLDAFLAEDERLARTRFVKCDVEGAELWVFEGGRRLLETARPVVFCEIQDEHCRRYGHTAADVFALFEALGYTREQKTPDDYLFLPPAAPGPAAS